MQKALLMSVIVAMLAIPVIAARDVSPRRGLQWALICTLVFNMIYLFCIRYIYFRL